MMGSRAQRRYRGLELFTPAFDVCPVDWRIRSLNEECSIMTCLRVSAQA